jgi:hypothetical protein
MALRNLVARDDAPLDLLAGLPSSFAGSTILPPGLDRGDHSGYDTDGQRGVSGYGIKDVRPPYEPIFGSCMTAKQGLSLMPAARLQRDVEPYGACRVAHYNTISNSLAGPHT